MGRARIFGVINPVTEAGDLFLLRQHLGHILHRVGALLVDGKEHLHDRLVGSPMQRPLERPDGAGNRRVNVGEGRCDHARGKGRSVQLMIGVQDEGDIQGLGGRLGWLFAGQHPEEICPRG